jgi:uncharacterized protein YifE (UPF0438 family)
MLANDPFNAYIEVEFGGQIEKYLIFRNYTPLEFKPKDSTIEYASYLSPMGALASRSTGFVSQVARRSGALKAKARFFPRRIDGAWDGANPEVEWDSGTAAGAFLRQLISQLSAAAAADQRMPEADLIPIEIKLVSRRSVVQVTELPDQAILDEVQDPIFRHSLSGSILIAGAPGTGKTTVQIKRLAQKTKWEFLTEAERTGLDRSAWRENEGWIFFTPTQLLKSYLKEALAKERLAASDSNVKVWHDYHLELLRRVRFLKVTKEDDGFLRTADGVRHLKEGTSRFCTLVAEQCFTWIRDRIDDHVRNFLRLPAGYARPITRIAAARPGLSKEERKKLGCAALFRQIPELFRKFREIPEIRERFYVGDAITDPGFRASRMDPQESAILLYVALRWVRETWSSFENDDTRANTGGPAYLIQDQQLIVAIDEATDFSAIELASMALLADPIRESVSVSGDLMQRLTTTGIMSWDELDLIAPIIPRFNLRRAYRQTDRLTRTANKLHVAFSGESDPATDPINPPQNDPPVLAVQKASPAEAAQWIGSRIQEIFDLNGGKLPSIGVLVPSESEVDTFSTLLREVLYDSSIDVDASLKGQSLGTAAKVRVFCVDHIKGLEFESVFFCDIDRMAGHQPDLIDKFVYVGLSRARSFLGMTYRQALPAKLEVIRDELRTDDRFFPESSLKTWRHYVDEEDLKEFTSEEQYLLDRHFTFYWELAQGTRPAETERQKAFMKMCQPGSTHKPDDDHQRAFRKFLDFRASEMTI